MNYTSDPLRRQRNRRRRPALPLRSPNLTDQSTSAVVPEGTPRPHSRFPRRRTHRRYARKPLASRQPGTDNRQPDGPRQLFRIASSNSRPQISTSTSSPSPLPRRYNAPVRLQPLQSCTPAQLAALWDEEERYWSAELFWDYRPTREVLERYVGARLLPGFALVDADEVSGYTYFVADAPVAFVGNLYVRDGAAGPSTYGMLIEACARYLQTRSDVRRIEMQVFEFNFPFTSVWMGLGFRPVRRRFMVCNLGEQTPLPPPAAPPPDWEILAWRPSSLNAVADVVYDSYIQSPDAEICWDYRTPAGCRRFLSNIIANPACGRFSPEETRLLRDPEGNLAAILLATRINPETGMIPQLSVLRRYQGRGLGGTLLLDYLRLCRRRGLARVALSVSEENRRALSLYERVGFRTHRPFHALLWDRPGT